jgi:hypothetical protein
MMKGNTAGDSWVIWDATRDPYNVGVDYLLANSSGAEGSGSAFDFLSNGFKPRETGRGVNGAGNTILFIAFAESPFKHTNAR